jgi:predicted Co/Zn/Cd cation transporter (cation efflux family)
MNQELSPAKLYLNYIIAGAIFLGLVGLIVGLMVHQSWVLFVGIGLGVVVGALLARMHVVEQRRNHAKTVKDS